ncbi:hypothetical protein E2C01_070236 [Portunus trituberculatus]|uniref:Uncharacterized protein n=1 Tax=Portunus trituberculatus TaxID=210409 RepID=A0A5B7I1Q5_PORTR|nr:hypothetical protein [Portunus trituberculatus]
MNTKLRKTQPGSKETDDLSQYFTRRHNPFSRSLFLFSSHQQTRRAPQHASLLTLAAGYSHADLHTVQQGRGAFTTSPPILGNTFPTSVFYT